MCGPTTGVRATPTPPTVFTVAKAAGLRTALFTQKVYVLGIADPRFMDKVELVHYRPATATADLRAVVLSYLRSARPHVMLVHIAEPDVVGHASGWISFAYLQALRRAVDAVGALRGGLRDLGLEAQTLMIITADHGGVDKDHVAVVPEVLTVPWIAVGAGDSRRSPENTVAVSRTP